MSDTETTQPAPPAEPAVAEPAVAEPVAVEVATPPGELWQREVEARLAEIERISGLRRS